MEEIFPRPPEVPTEELYATFLVASLLMLGVWRLSKIVPKAAKPIFSLWVKDKRLKDYSLLQLLLAIYWFEVVTPKEYPELAETFEIVRKSKFWVSYFIVILVFGGFIYKLALVLVSNYLVGSA